jgi:hypothetical protein
VLRPGTYTVDRLTLNAIWSSASDLVRQGLIRFEDDADIVPPVDDAGEDFTDFAEQRHTAFGLDPAQLETLD